MESKDNFRWPLPTDGKRFIAEADVLGILVDIGVDSHRPNAEPGSSRCNAASDLSSISDQEFAEHCRVDQGASVIS